MSDDFDAAKRVELCHHGRKIACPECVDEDPAVEYMLRGEVIGLRFKVREQAEEIEQLKERLVRLQDLHRDEHLRAEKAEAEIERLRAEREELVTAVRELLEHVETENADVIGAIQAAWLALTPRS